MSWKKSRNEKREVDWPQIKKELESVGLVEKCDILDIDHVEFKVNGVKVSFYANPNYSPVRKPVACLNNIVLADKTAIYNPQNEMFAAFETNRSLLKNETYPKFKKFSPGFAGV